MNESLFGDEQGDLKSFKDCVNKIPTLKQTGEKALEKKPIVYVDFMDLDKAYHRDNREGEMVYMETVWAVA